MSDGRQARPGWFAIAGAIALALLFSLGAGAVAQVPCLPSRCPTPSPDPNPEPTLTPPPSEDEPTPTPKFPEPSEDPDEILPTPRPSPKPSADIAEPSPGEAVEDVAELPEELEETFEVPIIARTRARNTVKLVELLEPLTKTGLPLEQVLIEGMGRFPVAGLAYYSDDWLNPRFTPEFHLHQGLDIFADFGTPIRAPDSGVVTRLSTGGAGGIGVWTRGEDGTSYYFAHLLERAEGLKVGQKLKIGTVIGYVGDTGNASGGTPHLHFEIHPAGGEAIPPKPSVDRWLDEAEALAPRWVQSRRVEVENNKRLLEADRPLGSQGSDLEATMLLTLLDPVGGSVGLLPRLELSPARRGPVSTHLLNQVIDLRLHGYVLVPGAHSSNVND